MKRVIFLTAIACMALAANLYAGPAGEIAAKHAAASAVELEAYLSQNPDAADRAEAIALLLGAYDVTGNAERTAELLQEQFDAIQGGAELESLQDLYTATVTLFATLVDSGDKEGAKKLLEDAKAKAKDHADAEQMNQVLSMMEGQLNQPGVGDVMEIQFKSFQGEDIDLAKLKGKVVLVDFWATWCGPCIAELPNVQETYKKYHDKGFEVLGISLDEDQDAFSKFLEEKDLPWPQHFDGKGWGNEISSKFGISGIPATFLVGADGKVVATNLRGEALEEAVAEELAKK